MKRSIIVLLCCLLMQGPFLKQSSACGPGKGARCTGSAYCRACSDCSRCAHCNAGGTCGVCEGTSSGRGTGKGRAGRGYSGTGTGSYNKPGAFVYVNSQTLNLRAGSGTSFVVIEKLAKDQKLMVLEEHGDWLRVRVVSTGSEGYVSKAYVRSAY